MQETISDLKTHLGYWLRNVSNQVSGQFARSLAVKGVSVAEWVLLRELYSDPSLGSSQLAEMMGMTRGGITKLVDRLVERALLARLPSLEDKRAQTLVLTPLAKGLVPELAGVADTNDAVFFGHLSLEDKATMRRILEDILKRQGVRTFAID